MGTRTTGYHIVDEPRPGALADGSTDPVWPLLALMFGGAWLSWPWFVFNAFAFGSRTRWREVAWVVGGFLGTLALVVGVGFLLDGLGAETAEIYRPYFGVTIFAFKALVSYRLYLIQNRTFEVYQYFGGVTRSGFALVAVGWLLRRHLLDPLPLVLRVVLQ